MEMPNVIQQAADLLKQAKRVLFLTSAGMSADSKIPTFRDKDGYWKNFPPFKEKNLQAQDLASPWAFRNELSHAWAFYEWRRQNAYENSPHEGYKIINHWIENLLEEGFIHTTNTDGYHLRSGCQIDKILEVHGSMWRLQCLDACSYNYWEEESSSSLHFRPKIYESFQLSNLYKVPRYCPTSHSYVWRWRICRTSRARNKLS